VANSRCYPCIFPARSQEATQIRVQNSQFPGRNSKPILAEHKSVQASTSQSARTELTKSNFHLLVWSWDFSWLKAKNLFKMKLNSPRRKPHFAEWNFLYRGYGAGRLSDMIANDVLVASQPVVVIAILFQPQRRPVRASVAIDTCFLSSIRRHLA
jgi:hypothetical protein